LNETVAGPSGAGSVVLELGAGIGALILYAPAGLDGREIEISPSGDPRSRRTHSRVRRRHTGGATVYAAVYPGLPAGEYAIWNDERSQSGTATITGGRITNCHWPG
jgi:hypothetical protein